MRFAGDALMFGDKFSPKFDQIGAQGMKGRSDLRNAKTASEAFTKKAGIQGDAMVEAAGHQASAIKAGGQAQGQASMMSGLGSMFSGIAGGIDFGTTGGATAASNAMNFGSNTMGKATSSVSGIIGGMI
tara:strand:- start:11 stop:397 length:387 start_codon:yes stop_codon:yes gene_type:complete